MQACRRFIVPAVIFVCAVSLAAWSGPFSLGRVQVDDRNHDGRPDIWRFFDAQGRLTRVAIDTNFDGRPDQEEQYQQEALTRRTSDRNFDQRVDLIEEFDPTSHQRTRSVVDVDFDGRADLLVLFDEGQPVHAEWARPTVSALATRSVASTALPDGSSAPREALRETPRRIWTAGAAQDPAQGPLEALEDPFAPTAAFRAHGGVAPHDPVVATQGALAVEAVLRHRSSFAPDRIGVSGESVGRSSLFLFAGPRSPPPQA